MAHYAVQIPPLLDAMRAAPRSDRFWETIDFSKPRQDGDLKYHARRGGHHRIPLEVREAVLGGRRDLEGIAARLRDGRSTRVVCLLGAGVSTSAGILAFRGGKEGEKMRKPMSPEGFREDPMAFWQAGLLGRAPTAAHRFLARLHREGVLLRVFTQNIDGLEAAAGLPADKIVECHGSATRCVCWANRRHKAGWSAEAAAAAREPPRCRECDELVRPDIVFFGESLPAAFALHAGADLPACDLLIVMGTSLQVYPVAGLVKQVGALTPRLCISRERMGVFSQDVAAESAYRDVVFQGDCDDAARRLAELAGWGALE